MYQVPERFPSRPQVHSSTTHQGGEVPPKTTTSDLATLSPSRTSRSAGSPTGSIGANPPPDSRNPTLNSSSSPSPPPRPGGTALGGRSPLPPPDSASFHHCTAPGSPRSPRPSTATT